MPLEVFPTLWNEENPCLLMERGWRAGASPSAAGIARKTRASSRKVELMAPLGMRWRGLDPPSRAGETRTAKSVTPKRRRVAAGTRPACGAGRRFRPVVEAWAARPDLLRAWDTRVTTASATQPRHGTRAERAQPHSNRRAASSAPVIVRPKAMRVFRPGSTRITRETRHPRLGYDLAVQALGYDVTFGRWTPTQTRNQPPRGAFRH